jgi:hypothetical protein
VAGQGIGFSGIAVRFVIALGLVCLTWNPTRYNYVAWAEARWQDLGPLVAFSGLVIFAGWIFFLRTTARSLGVFGIIMCTALAGVVLWGLFYYQLVNRESDATLKWIVLVLLSAVLAAGMSWAHLRNRWSGQATVDEVDDR